MLCPSEEDWSSGLVLLEVGPTPVDVPSDASALGIELASDCALLSSWGDVLPSWGDVWSPNWFPAGKALSFSEAGNGCDGAVNTRWDGIDEVGGCGDDGAGAPGAASFVSGGGSSLPSLVSSRDTAGTWGIVIIGSIGADALEVVRPASGGSPSLPSLADP